MINTFDPFYIEYQRIEKPLLSFKDECVSAVRNIKNVQSLPYCILMSGGIDSELVAESFRMAGVTFIAIIGRIMTSVNNDSIIFNEHDFNFAVKYCDRHKINYIFVDIDIFKLNSILCDYALSSYGFSPQYACHMYLMKWCSDNGYFFVAGNGEMDFVLRDDEYYMLDEQREFTLLNFCKKYNLNGEFQFWKQDGRLIASFITLPVVRDLMKNKVGNLLDHKHQCFNSVLKIEQRQKFTGFEHIQQWDYIHRNYMKFINGRYDNKYYTHISKFYVG